MIMLTCLLLMLSLCSIHALACQRLHMKNTHTVFMEKHNLSSGGGMWGENINYIRMHVILPFNRFALNTDNECLVRFGAHTKRVSRARCYDCCLSLVRNDIALALALAWRLAYWAVSRRIVRSITCVWLIRIYEIIKITVFLCGVCVFRMHRIRNIRTPRNAHTKITPVVRA